jgi:hypothetical protein
MSKAPETADSGRGPFRRLSDSETLLFLTRTLKPSSADAETPDVFARLQSLKDVLAQLESALLDLPGTAVKVRMWNELAKAKGLVTQITGDCTASAKSETAMRRAQTA